ncbi:MAG TPA: DUF2760 domain-containing protein [Oligoflexus sp.]|uniref:DUF2760 domain-containing protein n=1 Tax=Oligoflexus sp. TaxID=1971216 RepID=UPI002D26CC19|nr:DUF2760 domain-containing protein [Oligoflexus sp.]HYX36461.1 DUF2760 domain-containing protein [Oligoflexus sp.]
MQKQLLGFFALISAITTSIMLYNKNLDTSLIASIATLIFLALHLRVQRATPEVVKEPKPIKLIDELNDRLNASKQQVQKLQAQIQQLEAATKGADSEDAAVLMFLRVMQEKSRLLDFALTDIARLPDAQVGAAARVVHQGLQGLLQDSFEIKPIADQSEGQNLQLPEDFDSSRYRILQQSAAEQKPQGVILHRGWEVKKMNLPRSLRRTGDPLPSVLAPVEIEAREVLQ